MRRICYLLISVILTMPCLAGEWHPKITPVDKVEFNWPPPRQIGEQNYFTVARDGKAMCSIVIPANPSNWEDKSSAMLKTYLDLVTGGDFEIKREPASGPAIYIGDTEVGKQVPLDLPPIKYPDLTLPNLFGFEVKTVDKDTLVIRGRGIATTYAVASFVREYVGVRRYWPSEPGGIGDVYQPKPTLTIPKLAWVDWPYLISRHVGFNAKVWEVTHEGTHPTMFTWYRMGTSLSMMHNFWELIPVAEYGQTHPEYYPEINGVRQIPKGQVNWQPCVSNPDVVQICADKIIAAFDKDPNRICHALAVNDGAGNCECAKCRAMDSPDADLNTTQLTDRYVKFMNAVAEKVAAKHPDRLIGFLSYAAVRLPPATVKLHPNLVPYYCAMGRGLYLGWDEWMAAGAKNMGHYGYHDDRWFTIPKINPHQEAERIRYMVGSGVQRGYYKEFNPTYPLDAQAAIVCAEMQWDPRLDEDAILAKYYSDMFGDSAAEMQAFYERLEKDYEAWLKATAPYHPYGYDRSDLDLDHNYEQFQVLTAKGAGEARLLLLDAERKARDPKVKERVSIVKAIFQFVVYCDDEYWMIKGMPNCTSADKAYTYARSILLLARGKAAYKQKVMETEPVHQWTMIYREPYDQIKVGVIPQEVYQAIDRGFESAHKADPKDPMWNALLESKDPVIANSAQAAIAFSGNLPNLVEDPGFETGKPEMDDSAVKQGSAVSTREKPHSGQKCAMIWDCKDSNLVKRVAAKPGEKFWVSAWMRTLEYPGPYDISGLYGIRITSKQGDKALASVRMPIIPTDSWQEFRQPFTAPAGTDTIEVLVNVMRQHAKARAWVDDISVVRAPIEPLKLDAAGSAPSEQGPPE